MAGQHGDHRIDRENWGLMSKRTAANNFSDQTADEQRGEEQSTAKA